MSTKILCGPCGYEDNIKHAKKWCTNCEEGFCEDCEKVHRSTKMSRNHTLISISDYQKIKDVAISQTCVGHGKRYDLYCSVHDKPLCIDCVDQHKSCSQLVSLDAVAANAKQSTALAALEDTINGALQNVGKFIKNQETKGKELDKQESLIKKNIQETREKLNQHLDFLEKKLIQNLLTMTYNCKSTYGKIFSQLSIADQKLSQLKEEIETMKQMASDVQIFLGTREISRNVSEEINSVRDIIRSTNQFDIKLEINPSVISLLDPGNQLGIVLLEQRKSELEFKEAKVDQAQQQVSAPLISGKRVSYLKLKRNFKIKTSDIGIDVSACLILPNGNLLIANFYEENNLREYNNLGQYIRDISCSGSPYYLTLINSYLIAVTYLSRCDFEIINLYKKKVQATTLKHYCRGISFQDGKLYVVEDSIGIVVLDLSGKILNTIPIDTENVLDIATSKGMILYTNQQRNTIHCISMTGSKMWVYQHESIIGPQGLAVANEHEVFVVGLRSNNICILKHNELERTILLNETNGLVNPRAVYFSIDRKELLVCNEHDGHAAVYNVHVG